MRRYRKSSLVLSTVYCFTVFGIFEFFGKKSRGPPTSWDGLMNDPSEIPKQKHLTLPPTYLSKTKITGSKNNQLAR